MEKLADFYDDWAPDQVAEGINLRHLEIEAALRRAGWHGDQRVLEVGAGVGTLTELLARGLRGRGSLVAIDLSHKSIDAARQRLERFDGVTLLAGDVLETPVGGPFDVIVLPDVLEHIPIKLHDKLFERLASMLSPRGFILLNYPNPFFLEWCHRHRPDLLQPVDQPIHAMTLATLAASHGLYLDQYRTYSIWVPQGDYVTALLRPQEASFSLDRPQRRSQLLGAIRRARIALRRP